MAHFAEIKYEIDPTNFTQNKLWIVKRVIAVGNDIITSNGPLGENDMHIDGEEWCIKFFKGGFWKQTSYNSNFRKKYASIGDIYDPTKNKFISQQPFLSWSLDINDDWKAPINYPTIVNNDEPYPNDWFYIIKWDEDAYNVDNTKGWKAIKSNDKTETPIVYNWNGTFWISS